MNNAKLDELERVFKEGLAEISKLKSGSMPSPAETIAKLNRIRNFILWFNSNYRLVQNSTSGQGDKDLVEAHLRLFNGEPQVMVFYGKTPYRFKAIPRDEVNTWAALNKITGRLGLVDLPPELLNKYFTSEQLGKRDRELRNEGV